MTTPRKSRTPSRPRPGRTEGDGAALLEREFPQPVVEALRALGHDVLTSLAAGNANQGIEDDEVVRYATSQGRAVLTQNRRHFHREHKKSSAHAGIITCTVEADCAAVAARIHARVIATPDLNGQTHQGNQGVVTVHRSVGVVGGFAA